VRRGELFALLGTNGAGKTSAMEVPEGLAPPAQGAVRVLGCGPCRERALVRRRMGIMLQEGGFASDLTVAETGRMWAGTLSAPLPEQRDIAARLSTTRPSQEAPRRGWPVDTPASAGSASRAKSGTVAAEPGAGTNRLETGCAEYMPRSSLEIRTTQVRQV
jgi:ABC-type Fe3+/spermidine/putrescine transport system ATPase subunit